MVVSCVWQSRKEHATYIVKTKWSGLLPRSQPKSQDDR